MILQRPLNKKWAVDAKPTLIIQGIIQEFHINNVITSNIYTIKENNYDIYNNIAIIPGDYNLHRGFVVGKIKG